MRIKNFTLIRGRHPFVTVAELRRNPSLLVEPKGDWAGPRFEGSTATQLIERYCPKDEAILECGPIWGKSTEWLQERGYRDIRVLDFADMLRWGDRSRMQFGVIDFNTERMPYPDGSIGSAVAWGICEHLENPHHFIRELNRVLKDRGVLLLSMPNVLHLKSRLHFLRYGYFQRWNVKDNHIALFPHGLFEKSFLRHFDLLEVLYTHPNWDLYAHRDSKWLPANEWFGNYVVYVLRKKEFEPYA